MLRSENGEQHQMELADKHENGTEEWFCPTCGRRFIMQWPPNFKRIILESGDEEAVHTGAKGGVHSMTAAPAKESSLTETNTAPDQAQGSGLSPELVEALDELDFSSLDGEEE